MNIEDLTKDISALATLRKSDEILVFITGDKQPSELFSTAIAPDAIPIIDKHLYRGGKRKKISLFLYSTGGALEAPWPIVSIIREYCDEFEVIIPSKALSAATLVCLGADKLLMVSSSLLSPIDPQGTFIMGQDRKNIQVEDVAGFIDFAKSKVGIAEQGSLSEVLRILSSEIPPSILGSINRTHSQIRLLAEKLLKSHHIKVEDHQIKTIVENLTEKLFSHTHLISRREAKTAVGLRKLVNYATSEEEKLIRSVFQYYVDVMQLDKRFDPEIVIGDKTEETIDLKRAIIQSSTGEDAYITTYKVQRNPDTSVPKPFGVSLTDRGWKEVSSTNPASSTKIKDKGVRNEKPKSV